MFKTKLFLLSFLSILVLGTSMISAQEKKVIKLKKDGDTKWEMKAGLNLSEEQRKQFDDLDLQHEKKMIDLRAELQKSKLSKRELIKKGNFNKNDYLAAEEKIIQAENKIQMERAKLKMDKYSLLDENQKKNFFDEDDHHFMFKFDMDGLKDEMKILKQKLHRLPESFDWHGLDEDIDVDVELEGDEI